MKKRYIFITIVFIVMLISLSLIYHFKDRKSWALNLPPKDNIVNITIKQNTKVELIEEFDDIEEIMYEIEGLKRTTKEESIQEYPTNVKNEIIVNFNTDNNSSTLFVYKKKNKYYIEQPYNGIYRISADEYNSIEKYIR